MIKCSNCGNECSRWVTKCPSCSNDVSAENNALNEKITSDHIREQNEIADKLSIRNKNYEEMFYSTDHQITNERTHFIVTNEFTRQINFDSYLEEFKYCDSNDVFKKNSLNFKMNNIVKYELLQGNTVTQKSGLSSAIVGGLLLGPAGAAGGAMLGRKQKHYSHYTVILTMRNSHKQALTVYFGPNFEKAQELIAFLDVYFFERTEQKQIQNDNTNISIADEIMKYKQLLDMGAIDQDEYIKLKDKLINS